MTAKNDLEKRKKTILITGGAGYIGSHVNKLLGKSGYETIILDNLRKGSKKTIVSGTFYEGDCRDKSILEKIFSSSKIEAVMHFAADIDVGESVIHPLKYYENNVFSTLKLLETMIDFEIKNFIFSSTAAIFGPPKTQLIDENHEKNPINPYGRSKLIVENMLSDLDQAYGLKYSCLRYFNAAGGDPESEIPYQNRKESNLIPLILKSLKDPKGQITIFGTDYPTKDGTCIRDYIHVNDLGNAHILSMEKLFSTRESTHYNLGNGQGFSVKDVIHAVEKVTNLPVNKIFGERRAGDPPILVANSEKAKNELNWKPIYPSLEKMIEHAWIAMNASN